MPKLEIKWGLIFVATALAWMLLERLAGLHDTHIEKHAYLSGLFAIPAITLYVLALRAKRAELGGAMGWAQGFKAGMVVTAVVAVLSPLTQWITSNVISPHFFSNAIAAAVRLGKMSQAEAEAFFNYGSYVKQGLIGALVMGAVTSAIVAVFVRRRA